MATKGLLAKKIGMTQVFTEKGELLPVTVLEAGPCVVIALRAVQKDGYGAVQLGFGEAKEKQLSSELHAAQAEIATKERALAEAERALATMRAEFSLVSVDQRESAATAESRRVELLALRAQAEALKGQIESYDKETQELEARLRRKTTEAAKLNEQLAAERGRAEHFAGRATELDRALLVYKTEAEVLGRRVEETILQYLVEQARVRGISEIIGRYIPTAKNGLVRDHFSKLGFVQTGSQNGETTWQLAIASYGEKDLPLKVALPRA